MTKSGESRLSKTTSHWRPATYTAKAPSIQLSLRKGKNKTMLMKTKKKVNRLIEKKKKKVFFSLTFEEDQRNVSEHTG
jgi:hypothetical protein